MLRTIGNELKTQPLSSFGAFCGIASLFLPFLFFPNHPESSYEGSYNARLLFGLLTSLAVAYSFLFIAHILVRSKNLATELSAIIFIFIAALSSKITFSEIFLKTAKLELDKTTYTNLEEIMAILAFFLGVTISTVLCSPFINRHFYKTDSDDHVLTYLVLVPVICITWVSALSFPLK